VEGYYMEVVGKERGDCHTVVLNCSACLERRVHDCDYFPTLLRVYLVLSG